MINKLVINLCLTAAAFACVGCFDLKMNKGSEKYRTISTQPFRDTDTAKRENEIGLEHLANDDLDMAEDAFRRALTADVEFGPAHNNLGKVYFKQKKWYKAAWEFERARKLLPNKVEPLNNLGLVCEQAGDLDEAVEYYRQAIKLDSQNIRCRANLARAMIRRGDKTDEVRTLLKEILQDDDRPEWLIWAKKQLHKIGP